MKMTDTCHIRKAIINDAGIFAKHHRLMFEEVSQYNYGKFYRCS